MPDFRFCPATQRSDSAHKLLRVRDPGSGSGTARRLLLVANKAVLCYRRFASAVNFSAVGDGFSTWAESVCI
jgi:hypothetical protein